MSRTKGGGGATRPTAIGCTPPSLTDKQAEIALGVGPTRPMDQQASLAWLVARFGLALVAREAVYNRFFTNSGAEYLKNG